MWFVLCLHTINVGHVSRKVTCSQVHSRRGNRSWHSRSPSERTYRFYPSRPSSPGYGTEAARARTSSFQCHVEFGAGPLKERGRRDEEDKVHPHLRVVATEWPAVDKLLAEKVLVPDIKAAEDLNFRSIPTTPATLRACSPLNAPHQPSDLTPTKLIVLPIRRRKPKARKPVAAIVVQIMGNFNPEVFQSPMFIDVISVCLSRFGSPNFFAQGCKPVMTAMIVTTMQTVSHSVRSLCPPPDIALECICETALGFPASRPSIAPGSEQDRSIP